jgi:hypothetical protein
MGITNLANLSDRKYEVMAMAEGQEKKNVFDKEMPAGMGKVFGKVGAKSWLDFLVMIAGIICIINIIIQWAIVPIGANWWKLIYFIIVLLVYVETALYIKLGPFFASKFKNVSGAFSFLRDENDAKNFVVIMGAWTCVLDALSNAISGAGANMQNWVLWVYVPALVIFGIFLLKGFFARK